MSAALRKPAATSVPGNLTDAQATRISKCLSFLLRHGAEKEGLSLRSDGYIAVDQLLRHPKLRQVPLATLQYVVDRDAKQRYTLREETSSSPPGWYIRANQGHSLKASSLTLHEHTRGCGPHPFARLPSLVADLELALIRTPTEIPVVVHGSQETNWPSIAQQGLKRMSRNHIHFAPNLPGANEVISGMRKKCDLRIYIDVPKAMQDGIRFYRSKNNVILSEGIDGIIAPKYFARIDHLTTRQASPGHRQQL
ncbi:tRNA 2'-phosphotransferase [Dimargaris cristalligena]|nr:tRNA 2'-phosphotransferase [Dimargaris cristalligena]